MGDVNLNRRNPDEHERLIQLCQENKLEAVLKEPTTKSFHQPDHILVDRSQKKRVYITSFYNFISDHKSIVARIGLGTNTLLKGINTPNQNGNDELNFDSNKLPSSKKTSNAKYKANANFHKSFIDTNIDLSCLEG